MSNEEKEIFNNTLKHFTEQYGLTIKYPYNDSYLEIYKNNNNLGGLNPSGYNLLRNLRELCSILEQELV